MPGFTLITGNRLEDLAQRCSLDLASDPLPPMAPEVISVQSMGMMKWLSLRLAEQCGVWANCSYIFPNKMSSMLLNGFFPGSGNERYFDRDSMPWQVMRILKSVMNKPVFSQPAGYISDDVSGIKLYQLSSGISDVFDQYMTFRPEMITRWDRGADKDLWQAELWRMITSDINSYNPPFLMEKLKVMLSDKGYRPAGQLPGRLTLFGISYLPLFHINLLFAASSFIDIRMYMLNPSAAYWGDIVREKEKVKIVSRFPIPSADPETELHLDTGNPLLASMGRPGRDFIRNIFSMDCVTGDCFFEPEGSSLLAMVQQDIFNMTDRARSDVKLTVEQVAADRSIIINSCHSPMRETEVLRDYILDLFDSDPTLEPRDIIVMAPDIEIYSGCVESVFSGNESGIAFPFRIADRKPAGSEPSVAAFFDLLDLPASRFTASRILSLLDCADVMEHFGFSPSDRERITLWIADSGIRWGVDSEFKRKMDLPCDEANTFSAGIKRLITGLLVSGDGLCLGVLPLASVDAGDSLLLGRFITYIGTLEEIAGLLSSEHTLDEWGDIFMFIIRSLFSSDDGIPAAMMPVAEVASLLCEVRKSSGYDSPAGIAAVREFAESRVAAPRSVKDFISGALTFCEMLPMRSIPCRIVCIMGVDSRSFPGRSRPLSFDLMAAEPRRGDRSLRDEERYMFLETIISARDNLYISYTGQNIINNTQNDPSPVVSELIDYIASFGSEKDSEEIKKLMVTRQRLHRYSPAYFMPGSGLFSYSAGNMREAAAALNNPGMAPVFFSGGITATDDEYSITTDDLAWFLRNPARTICSRRLGISLEVRDTTPGDEEPFAIERAVKYDLDDRLLQIIAGEGDTSILFEKMKAAGMLPHGSAGRAAFNVSADRVKKFLSMIPGVFRSPESFEAEELLIEDVHIRLKPGTLYGGEQVLACMGRLRSIDLLRAWTAHLALCAAGGKIRTRLFYVEEVKGDYSVKQAAWDYIPGARDILAGLAVLYKEGMVSPVELFPESSRAFAEAFMKAGSDEPQDRGMKAAKGKFYNFNYPEKSDPYILKVFGAEYSPKKKFTDTALRVYGPLIENMSGEVRDDA